jgi:transcriptional regulator with XRE-family HTH domain
VAAKDPTLRRFGENVRARREALDLSQEQLAERAELDRTYISGVERGARNIGIQGAIRIARALKTTVAALSVGIEK